MNGDTDVRISWLKEIVVALLSTSTFVALLFVYWRLIDLAPTDPNAANVEKVGTALFGIFAAFVGYYAGRIPAERSAAASQKNADAQREIAEERRGQVRRAKALLTKVGGELAPAARAHDASSRQELVRDIDTFLNTEGS